MSLNRWMGEQLQYSHMMDIWCLQLMCYGARKDMGDPSEHIAKWMNLL